MPNRSFKPLAFAAGVRSVRERNFAHIHPRHKREAELRSARQMAGYKAVADLNAQLDAEDEAAAEHARTHAASSAVA